MSMPHVPIRPVHQRKRQRRRFEGDASSSITRSCWSLLLLLVVAAATVSTSESFQSFPPSFGRGSQRLSRSGSNVLIHAHRNEGYSLSLRPYFPPPNDKQERETNSSDSTLHKEHDPPQSVEAMKNSRVVVHDVDYTQEEAREQPAWNETNNNMLNSTNTANTVNSSQSNRTSSSLGHEQIAISNNSVQEEDVQVAPKGSTNPNNASQPSQQSTPARRDSIPSGFDISRFLKRISEPETVANTTTIESAKPAVALPTSLKGKSKDKRSTNMTEGIRSLFQTNTFPKQVQNKSTSIFANTSSLFLPHKNPNDPLTLRDLESILLTSRFVRERDLEAYTSSKLASQPQQREQGESVLGTSRQSSPGDMENTSKSKSVAFPQPSVLSFQDLKWGTTVSACLCGTVIGASILPNLWLIGGMLGAYYGNELGTQLQVDHGQPPTGFVALLVTRMGRRLAKIYLQVYDSITVLWFLYKTGQLSYEYFKRYEEMDQRFAIQSKLDAWNARFVQGKIAFDNWERENEVGRKVMASLRTFWLVEQRSFKKSKRALKSKYRVVQLGYDAVDYTSRFVKSVLRAVTGGSSTELHEFFRGLKIDMTEARMGQVGSRLGAALAALVALNLAGTLFALSPTLVSLFAVLVGVTWPSWVNEFMNRMERFFEETRALGRGEELLIAKTPSFLSRHDKTKYHYYVRSNGKRRYYLMGQPWIGQQNRNERPKRKWPWESEVDKNERRWPTW